MIESKTIDRKAAIKQRVLELFEQPFKPADSSVETAHIAPLQYMAAQSFYIRRSLERIAEVLELEVGP